MSSSRQGTLAAAIAVVLAAAWATPAAAQWQIDSKDGKSNIKIGFLAQPQIEAITAPSGSGTSTNLYLRRFRILLGGKVSDKWTYFFETDSPNLGKGTGSTGVKDTGSIYIQDAFFTYNHNDAFKVDAGMILLPLSHNNEQSAASLLPVDYGPYSFVESGPLGERVGRDYGVQLRGYPFKTKFEYRLGVYQGIRGTDSKNDLRVTARAVYYPFGAETGFFYTGTFQGQKRLASIGTSVDKQNDYYAWDVDGFIEQPIDKGQQGVTFQVDFKTMDGKTFVPALPKETTVLLEAAYHLGKGKASPFIQYAARNFDNAALADQSSWQVGLAYWMAGHQRNLKFSAGRQHTDRAPDRTQVLLQLQIFYY